MIFFSGLIFLHERAIRISAWDTKMDHSDPPLTFGSIKYQYKQSNEGILILTVLATFLANTTRNTAFYQIPQMIHV